MKSVAYVADTRGTREWVKDAVIGAAQSNNAVVHEIEDYLSDPATVRPLWTFLSEADVVVAHIKEPSANIFFELGIAVGLGKPIIIITTDLVSIPFDLRAVYTFLYESKSDSKKLAFKLEEALFDYFHRQRARSTVRQHGVSRPSPAFRHFDHRQFIGFRGASSGRAFEEWFAEVARQVPAWEIISARGSDQGYDLVLWNSAEDSDLSVLGNPLVVELKAIKQVTKNTLEQVAAIASKQGLKGVIFVTTANMSAKLRSDIDTLYNTTGVVLVTLDRADLESLNQPVDLLQVIKRRVNDFRRYGSV